MLTSLATQAKGGGDMSSGGFAARAQGAGDRNVNTGIGQHHGTGSHGHGGSGGAAPGAKK